MEYRLRIRRFNPEREGAASWGTYQVDLEPGDRVLDALVLIQRHQDGTLTFRKSCAHGVCGSDGMVINGRSRLACQLLMKDAARENDPIVVEPLPAFPLIKDLVVDQELFFARYRSITPYLVAESPASPFERLQSPRERERFASTSRCILCGICTSSCPTFWADKDFIGPAALVQAHRFIFDSRDLFTAGRLERVADSGGVFSCRSIYNCAEACPRRIEIVRAINEMRKAVLRGSRRSDPLPPSAPARPGSG